MLLNYTGKKNQPSKAIINSETREPRVMITSNNKVMFNQSRPNRRGFNKN